MTANFNEDSSDSEHQSNSTIQRTSREAENRRSKTGKSKESQGVESIE